MARTVVEEEEMENLHWRSHELMGCAADKDREWSLVYRRMDDKYLLRLMMRDVGVNEKKYRGGVWRHES
jgi:hypothetical protein